MKHSLIEYIHLGGYVMYILVFLNIIGLSILLWKFIQISIENKKAQKVITQIITSVHKEHSSSNLKDLEDAVFNRASKHLLSCETGMNTIKIIATIAPILGLLGTVIGVLQSFETIAAAGFSQGANTFASGISLALITTVGGLIVALPHYIGFNYLSGSLTKLETKYESIIINRITREKIS
ncbi:MotA/TolQ/ExbB proton channel family protein [Arcobacter sp. CECT 8985]|uniref:MotA/TolQ/ExbB proton channel family protein n=1 Tax=Arcobacter sp. CECT 8985 TaxID=1935424 RepID=UPI00100AEC27|nr:MotA/TolQ/ExbB proton channel family protein [Arcobacter sp. CECT 8985]RXJ86848.1 biopolymer transporter ExbB [Arcobacter sp. CECT 8985]